MDACNGNLTEAAWAEYRDGIKRSGHEMVLSICAEGLVPVWQWGARVGHMWRVTGDIENVRRSNTATTATAATTATTVTTVTAVTAVTIPFLTFLNVTYSCLPLPTV